jgi:hypothetical protein
MDDKPSDAELEGDAEKRMDELVEDQGEELAEQLDLGADEEDDTTLVDAGLEERIKNGTVTEIDMIGKARTELYNKMGSLGVRDLATIYVTGLRVEEARLKAKMRARPEEGVGGAKDLRAKMRRAMAAERIGGERPARALRVGVRAHGDAIAPQQQGVGRGAARVPRVLRALVRRHGVRLDPPRRARPRVRGAKAPRRGAARLARGGVERDAHDHRYIPVRIGNSGAKTTGYALTKMLAAFYQWNITPEWGSDEYRILHLAPLEAQALESKGQDRQDPRRSRARADVPRAWRIRLPAVPAHAVLRGGQAGRTHQGFFIMDGASTITFRPTTYKAKGADGTDPALVTWDELRHEKAFNEVLNTIIIPRFLRVSFARALFFFTSLGASIDLTMAFNRGVSGLPEDIDWLSLSFDDLRAANPTISEDTIARAHRNLDKRYLPMVMSGRSIQPEGAKFSLDSVERAFIGTTEPAWLSDMVGIRDRLTSRCETCAKIKTGEQVLHWNKSVEHPAVAFTDPASSSPGADSIVSTVWDLQPPTFPRRWAEVIYLKELPPGTKIQRVGLEVALLSMIIHGVSGFDQNSALGHNITDQLADFSTLEEALNSDLARKYLEKPLRDALLRRTDLSAEPDIAPIEHNTKKEKDIDLDFFAGILDLEKWACPFHFMTRAQMSNYVRKDTGIAQDFVMCQVGAAWLAKGEMPDMYAERSSRDKGGRAKPKKGESDDVYLGVGGDDSYFDLPGDIGETLGRIDAYAEEG